MIDEIDDIFVSHVRVGPRHRAVQPDRLTALRDSVERIGLQTPISVWLEDDEEKGQTVHLVAGLHRLEVAKMLGWGKIPAVFVQMSPIEREMWEISENLHRVGLTKEERDEHIRRYAELIEAREQEIIVTQNAEQLPRPVGRPKSTVTKIAEETGLSDDTVRRAINPKPQPVDDGLRREAEHREQQAKEDRKRAQIELCDWLLDTLTPPQWDTLIRLMDAAGGTLTAKALRDWQSPMEAA